MKAHKDYKPFIIPDVFLEKLEFGFVELDKSKETVADAAAPEKLESEETPSYIE